MKLIRYAESREIVIIRGENGEVTGMEPQKAFVTATFETDEGEIQKTIPSEEFFGSLDSLYWVCQGSTKPLA